MVTPNSAPHKNKFKPLRKLKLSTVLTALTSTEPFALIDCRTRQDHVNEHPLFSVNVPLDSFEARVSFLFATHRPSILLISESETHGEWALTYLQTLGFTADQVSTVTFTDWVSLGLPTWGGEYTASKAFGEWVEATGQVTSIDPDAYQHHPAQLQIDVRPAAEYRRFTIPGSLHCPTGRLGALTDYPEPWYVHCAGRTRGIIAAQTLHDISPQTAVRFIAGGTQGWELSGGQRCFEPELQMPQLVDYEEALHRAQVLINHHALRILDSDDIGPWLQQNPIHLQIEVSEVEHSATQVATTSLIQSTDQYIATHNVPILIRGDHPLDVCVAVLWLRRMGWDASGVFSSDNGHTATDAQTQFAKFEGACDDLVLLDIRSSQNFSRSRVRGSQWYPRSAWTPHQPGPRIGLICRSDQSEAWISNMLSELGWSDVQCIQFDALDPAYIETSPVTFETPPTDQAVFFPDRHRGNLLDAKGYLDWEHTLLETLRASGEIPWAPITAHASQQQPKSHLTTYYQSLKLGHTR